MAAAQGLRAAQGFFAAHGFEREELERGAQGLEGRQGAASAAPPSDKVSAPEESSALASRDGFMLFSLWDQAISQK
jgi:hypothetical protein